MGSLDSPKSRNTSLNHSYPNRLKKQHFFTPPKIAKLKIRDDKKESDEP